ncbi:MAG: hypothetical protein ABW190_02720 [Rhizobacter sp.]
MKRLRPIARFRILYIHTAMRTSPKKNEMSPPAWERTRVLKKMAPYRPGTQKLSSRFGHALVCVRHREDAQGLTRYITVELVIQQSPIQRRKPEHELLLVRLDPGRPHQATQVIAAGGEWDPQLQAWRLTRRATRQLQLLDRVIKSKTPHHKEIG